MRSYVLLFSLLGLAVVVTSSALQVRLEPKDTIPQEGVGQAVAIDGDLVAIGVPFHTLADRTGAVFLFRRDPIDRHVWQEVDELLAADGLDLDRFGTAISLDGETLAIGASHDGDDSHLDAGSVYIFRPNAQNPDSWQEMVKITSDDVINFDLFGSAVALDGDTLVVGAPGDRNFGSLLGGSAYVFQRTSGPTESWQQVARLRAEASHPEDNSFGHSVALDGDVIVIGSLGSQDIQTTIGNAFVFYRDEGGPNNWGLVKTLESMDSPPSDRFGHSVALRNDTILVGDSRHEINAEVGETGAVFVFRRDVGGLDNWGKEHKIVALDGIDRDYFGSGVDFDGKIVAIGAENDRTNGEAARGSVYLFDATYPQPWSYISKLTGSDTNNQDRFGIKLALFEDTVVVGTEVGTSFFGKAYINYDLHIPGPDISTLFKDGFEGGTLDAWDVAVP